MDPPKVVRRYSKLSRFAFVLLIHVTVCVDFGLGSRWSSIIWTAVLADVSPDISQSLPVHNPNLCIRWCHAGITRVAHDRTRNLRSQTRFSTAAAAEGEDRELSSDAAGRVLPAADEGLPLYEEDESTRCTTVSRKSRLKTRKKKQR